MGRVGVKYRKSRVARAGENPKRDASLLPVAVFLAPEHIYHKPLNRYLLSF